MAKKNQPTYVDGSPMSAKDAARAARAEFFECGCRKYQPHKKDCRFAAANETNPEVIAAHMATVTPPAAK